MAERTCSIEGCDRPDGARGWCSKHYARWRRHGDPLGGRTAWGVPLQFISVTIESSADECVLWPFAVVGAGYGSIEWDGRTTKVTRVVLELSGAGPGVGLEARHSCRAILCINPRHLSWGTHIENMGDKKRDGTYGRKITEEQVREIRRLAAAAVTQREIAALFNVNQAMVSRIVRGTSWAHVT